MTEIDELAETIMDCVMNSHTVTNEGIKYVEDHLPMKEYPNQKNLRLELYEKTGKERIQKVALIFKNHYEARKWYAQFKLHAQSPQKVHRKATILNNVLFKIGDYGKSLFQYAEYICEFIDQQPLCVLQHVISDQDLKMAENYPYYFKINWNYKGFMQQREGLNQFQSSLPKIERQIGKLKDEEQPRRLDAFLQKFTPQNNSSDDSY